jgi:hypothetical protein
LVEAVAQLQLQVQAQWVQEALVAVETVVSQSQDVIKQVHQTQVAEGLVALEVNLKVVLE